MRARSSAVKGLRRTSLDRTRAARSSTVPLTMPEMRSTGVSTQHGMRAHELADAVAVHVRHDHVADDEVGHRAADALDRLGARRGGEHLESLGLERALDHLAHGEAVVHDKHTGHGSRSSGGGGGTPAAGRSALVDLGARLLSSSWSTLFWMVRRPSSPRQLRRRGLNRKVPSGSNWAEETMAAKALSPVRAANSAWTTRPESKSSDPSPAASRSESRPVLPAERDGLGHLGQVEHAEGALESPRPPPPRAGRTLRRGGGGGRRAGRAAHRLALSGATWRRSFEIRSSTAETTKSPASSMSTPAWATAHGRRARGAGEEEKGNVVGGRVAPDDGAELDTVHVIGAAAAHDEVGAVALERGEGEGSARGRGDV